MVPVAPGDVPPVHVKGLLMPFEQSEGPRASLDISIIVPVYGNAGTLVELHRRLCLVMELTQCAFEVIFVNDAGPDDSLAILERLTRRDRRVCAIALEYNVGQHMAVLVGLAYARGAWCVVMDADLQDPPEAVPRLLLKAAEGFCAVFAGRRGRYESTGRLITSRLFKMMLHVLCGVPVDAGIFLAMDSSVRRCLLTMGGPYPSIVAMVGCTALPMASVPVVRDARPIGRTSYNSLGRIKSGLHAIAWIFHWKLRLRMDAAKSLHGAVHGSPKIGLGRIPVAALMGARFRRCS
jgi:glycosyltransferase involved in cell wall biosynthesis